MRESGSRTTEFWVTLMVIVLGAVTSGLGQFYSEEGMPDWARATTVAIGSIMAVLAALGYTAARTVRKNRADDNATAITTAAEVVKIAEADKIASIAEHKKAEAEKGSALIWLLGCVTFVLLLLSGCGSLQMKAYDPVTETQIRTTIEHYEQNAEWLKTQVPDRATEIDFRKRAEVTRLEKWLKYEKAKELTDVE